MTRRGETHLIVKISNIDREAVASERQGLDLDGLDDLRARRRCAEDLQASRSRCPPYAARREAARKANESHLQVRVVVPIIVLRTPGAGAAPLQVAHRRAIADGALDDVVIVLILIGVVRVVPALLVRGGEKAWTAT